MAVCWFRPSRQPGTHTPGNHDIYNDLSIDDWRNRFGRSYYHFIYHNVLFIVLNTEDPPTSRGRIGKEQLAWAKQLLIRHADVRWTFVFMHKPLWQYGDESNWNDVEDVLGDRTRVTFFAGHHHSYANDNCFTSLKKVCAQSFSPSTMVRYGNS